MTINDIIFEIEKFAPLPLQESYDNSGLQIGNKSSEIDAVLLTTDVTEATIEEAIRLNAKLIISHHPLLFHGLKRITGGNSIERIIIKALRHDIAIYSAHTNLDKCRYGVSYKMAELLGLRNIEPLVPEKGIASKIIYYIPTAYASFSRQALQAIGLATFDNYDSCSFTSNGIGEFRPLAGAAPYCGQIGEIHAESECRIELTVYNYQLHEAIRVIKQNHPYQTPVIDIIPLSNVDSNIGLGAIGDLSVPLSEAEFLSNVKEKFNAKVIRHSMLKNRKIQKVALCGGAGAEFIQRAINKQADIYITADIKYHDFLSIDNQIIIADIGHFESEHITKLIFYEQLCKKISNFAIYMATSDNNPVYYV